MAGHRHPSYFKIYILLVALFLVSWAGPEVSDRIFGEDTVSGFVFVLFAAFGIAIVKAYYVCAYFMHLKFEKIYAPYLLLTMLALMFVFFFGTASDAMLKEGHNWKKPYTFESTAGEGHAEGGDSSGHHEEVDEGHGNGGNH